MKCLILLAVVVAATAKELKIRVDDEVAVWRDGSNILNTFATPGFQWRDDFTRTIPDNTNVLVIKVYNQGGPGDIICTIDGEDCSEKNWRCNDLGANQDPNTAYPGVHTGGFDDTCWDNLALRRSRDRLGKFDNSIQWWWGGLQSRTWAVCRLVLARSLKIRVDDEVAVYADGNKILNTWSMAGFQHLDDFTRTIPCGTKVLVTKIYNQGGPGDCICTIDGVDCSTLNWKCNSIGANQQPGDAYPEIHTTRFNDVCWDDLVLRPSGRNRFGKFDNSIQWWWGGPQSRTYAVCRLVLG